MGLRKVAGVQVTVATYIAQFGANNERTLRPDRADRIVEIYQGGPPAELHFGGSLGKIGLVGIRRKQALLFVECRGFTPAEQYNPSRSASVLASTVSVPLRGYREIIVWWDNKDWLYRLSCKKL